jgi:hypothetical protein
VEHGKNAGFFSGALDIKAINLDELSEKSFENC